MPIQAINSNNPASVDKPFSGLMPAFAPTPSVASVPPRPMRPLTGDEVTLVNFRLAQPRPIKKKGLDLPTTNLIANPEKQAVFGAVRGGIVAFAISSLLIEAVYKSSSPAMRFMNIAICTVFGAAASAMRRSKQTQAQNEFAINLLQHGVTQYDSIPKGMGINHNIWKQLSGIG